MSRTGRGGAIPHPLKSLQPPWPDPEPARKVIIEGLPFVTKKACLAYFRSLRARATPGQPLPETELLRALFARHPEHELLEGVGILYFTVAFNAWNKRAFKLVRTDGSSALFSLRTCVTGKLSAAEQDCQDIDLDADFA